MMDEVIRVLYVDDEPALLEIAQIFLEKDGEFRVSTANSAREALASPAIKTCDAIVADYQMPEMDGITFLKIVRERFSDLPFILFTGRGREEVVIDAINYGADFYLQKGGDPKSQFAELTHKIRQAVRRKQAERSLRNSERRLTDIINFLPDATFAIDKTGIVIAWNRAMERMTGVPSSEVLGKGNNEYSLPFYRERRPILIDLVLNYDTAAAMKYPAITRDGMTLFSEITVPHFNQGKGAALWFTASPLYDTSGAIVGAIESIREVTARKRADEALRESEERFRGIFENSPLGMALVTPDFRFHSVNPTWVSMTGYSEDELVNMSFKDITHPDHMAEDIKHIRRLIAGEIQVYSTEKRYIRKDGTILWGHLKVTTINDPKGSLQYLAAQIEDVTDHKLAEEELKKSEERYRNVVEAQTELISRFRPDGTHVFVNEAYCRYFNLDRDEILGHRFQPAIPVEDQERVKQFFTSLTPEHPVGTIEHRIILPDGTLRWQRWSDHAIFDPSGAISEYQSVGQDITERKLEEQRLRENEQRMNSIYNTVGDVIFQLAVEPDGQYRFSSINSAFTRTTGLSPDQVVGKTVAEVIPEPSLSLVREKYRQAISERTIVRWEETTDYPAGMLTGEVSIAPIFDEKNSCTYLIGSVHDITGRKKYEEEIAFNNIILSTQQEATLDAILIVDDEGKILSYNRNFARIWGIPDSLLSSRFDEPLLQYVTRQLEDPDAFLSRVRYLYDHKEEKSFEELLLKDGRVFERFSAPIVGEGSGYYGRVWYFRDITNRKKVEDALKTSEQRLQDAMDLAGLVNWEFDFRKGAFIFDDRFFTLIGSSQEIEGSNQIPVEQYRREFVHPDDSLAVEDEIRKAMNSTDTEYVSRREHRIIRRDGGIRYVSILIRVMRDAEKRTVKVHGTMQDLTEQKRIENALRESEDWFRSIVETSPNIIWELDPAGKFRYISPAVTSILGYPPEELIGASITDLVAPENRAIAGRLFAQIISPESTLSFFEITARHRDGHEVILEIRPSLKSNEGKLSGLQGIAVDVTERKRSERAIFRANRQLQLLGSSTRHDILNKISVIRGFLQVTKMKYSDPKLLELLQKIESNAKVIQSVMEFTRVYQDLGTHEPQWIDLETITPRAQVPATINLIANIRGISLFADPMLELVFSNLLDNSIRHGEHVTEIRVLSRHENGDLVIIWEDNGIGVAADEKDKIFERGFGKHTGLGLFLVREILSLTGISITETGEPGKGARFEISIPDGQYRISE